MKELTISLRTDGGWDVWSGSAKVGEIESEGDGFRGVVGDGEDILLGLFLEPLAREVADRWNDRRGILTVAEALERAEKKKAGLVLQRYQLKPKGSMRWRARLGRSLPWYGGDSAAEALSKAVRGAPE